MPEGSAGQPLVQSAAVWHDTEHIVIPVSFGVDESSDGGV
jgi:hypothetical protein